MKPSERLQLANAVGDLMGLPEDRTIQPNPETDTTVTMGVRLLASDVARIRTLAKRAGLRPSTLVRTWIRERLGR